MAELGNGTMLDPAGGLGGAQLHGPPPHMDQSLLIFIGLYTVYWLNDYSVLIKILNTIEEKLTKITQETVACFWCVDPTGACLTVEVLGGVMLVEHLLCEDQQVSRAWPEREKWNVGSRCLQKPYGVWGRFLCKPVIAELHPSPVTVRGPVVAPWRRQSFQVNLGESWHVAGRQQQQRHRGLKPQHVTVGLQDSVEWLGHRLWGGGGWDRAVDLIFWVIWGAEHFLFHSASSMSHRNAIRSTD